MLFYISFYLFLLLSTAESSTNNKLRCATKPKVIVNIYEERLQNYVQPNPFASACLKCSMCLAVAKEYDQIFKPISAVSEEKLQSNVVKILETRVKELCIYGFENYDLRRFKKHQAVSDQFQCSTHVNTKVDGKWTEKLREMCEMYSSYVDFQHLLNTYLNNSNNIGNYLCRNKGIFRDCASLTEENFLLPHSEDEFFNLCSN